MTAPARLTQGDMDRAMKAAKHAGYERARIVMDFANQKIEVIIGETALNPTVPDILRNDWADDDV